MEGRKKTKRVVCLFPVCVYTRLELLSTYIFSTPPPLKKIVYSYFNKLSMRIYIYNVYKNL